MKELSFDRIGVEAKMMKREERNKRVPVTNSYSRIYTHRTIDTLKFTFVPSHSHESILQ